MKKIDELIKIIAKLRAPEGCPWDREQTPQSILQHMIEEAYEAIETIEHEDWDKAKEELGDLLLHIVMQAQMASEKQHFTMEDIVKELTNKIVRRHPHVFASTQVKNADKVMENWEKIKEKERDGESILAGVPKSLPALLKAYRMGVKTARIGFDFPDLESAFKKVEEEIQEFKEAQKQKKSEEIEHELGDLLFALTNVARQLKINPEEALRGANQRFQKRFQEMERVCAKQKIDLKKLSLSELDELWESAKRTTEPENNSP